jgi:hypothetical protein
MDKPGRRLNTFYIRVEMKILTGVTAVEVIYSISGANIIFENKLIRV